MLTRTPFHMWGRLYLPLFLFFFILGGIVDPSVYEFFDYPG